jgi:regulatory protein
VTLVTAITRQARRRRSEISLDDGTNFSLSLDLIAESGLGEGASLTEDQRSLLEAEDARRGATAAALRLLASGPRSERDLRDRLRPRFRQEAVDQAVGRMRELGYVDDAAFARAWVEGRQASTPRSRRYLQFELNHKGVERALIEDAIEPVSDEEAAYEAASRRLRALRNLDRTAFERRLGSFLTSRGFGYGVARTVIERCWAEGADEKAKVDLADPPS